MTAYQPKSEVNAAHLAIIRGAVLAADPANARDASELCTATTALLTWAVTVGLPVDERTISDPDIRRRFALTGCTHLTASTVANYNGRLARVARAGQPAEGEPPLRASDPSAPYTSLDIDDLLLWADGQPAARRSSLLAALALSLGCGADNADARSARGTDITVDDQGVHLAIHGAHPRTVTCLRRYEGLLADLAHAAAGGRHLVAPNSTSRPHNLFDSLVARATKTDPSAPRFTCRRGRATWIVHHLTAGTPLRTLVATAGVADLTSFGAYLPWVPTLDPAAAIRALRGTHP